MPPTSEVTAADIARIAGVGRAAVSNWRRRHPDFPQPVGGPPNSPTFALPEVEAWLSANGRLAQARRAPKRRRSDESRLARSMAALLPPLSSGAVLDPMCSDGECLTASAERFGSRISYVGQTPDPDAAHDATAALAATGATKVNVVQGTPFTDDRLADCQGKVDAVISMPPMSPAVFFDDVTFWEFGPPSRADGSLALLQACYAYTKPGGIVVVMMPFGMATRASGRRVRAEMLRAGALTHVIGLPPRVLNDADVPAQIWVLRRPTGRPAYKLRMVDLTSHAPADLPADEDGWRAAFANPALTADVQSIELLDDEVLLIPSAHIPTEARDIGPDYRRLAAAYHDAVSDLPLDLPRFKRSTPDETPMVSVADLARAGALEIRERRQDLEAGDVIVSAFGSDRITVVTDPDGDYRGTVVRCDPEQIDPYFFACFLRSEANRKQAVGTLGGSFRLDVRRGRVPRIPLEEQRRYGDAFRRLMEFAGKADRVATAATDAVNTAIHGLTSGAFAPERSK